MVLENRIGKFSISLRAVENNWRSLLHIFSNFVIVRAEYIIEKGVIEYVALSPLFDAIGEGLQPPYYELDVTRTNVRVHKINTYQD